MIQVIERFHKILEYVSRNPEQGYQLGELARLLGVSSPACANIVRSMVELGYLKSLGARRGYVQGPAVFMLALNTPYRHLINVARPVMEELSGGHNNLVVLVVENSGKRMELLRLDKESTISISANAASSFYSLFRVNTGILLLSFMEEKRVRYFWDRDNGADNILKITNFAEFRRRSLDIARAGELVLPDTMSVALYRDDNVIGALGITFDADDNPAKSAAECRRSARKLNELL